MINIGKIILPKDEESITAHTDLKSHIDNSINNYWKSLPARVLENYYTAQKDKSQEQKYFKEILLNIQNKTMLEQEHYLNQFFENWKKATEQVDDVLVIGVRV